MTVHDIGKNHNSFVKFVNSEPMRAITQRAVFLHVCVPGQEPNAPDFKDEWVFINK
jgi:Ndr family.